jgi:hypothetical protein
MPAAPRCGAQLVAVFAVVRTLPRWWCDGRRARGGRGGVDLVVADLEVVAALHEVARQAGADARLEVSGGAAKRTSWAPSSCWSPRARGTSATSPRSTTRGGERARWRDLVERGAAGRPPRGGAARVGRRTLCCRAPARGGGGGRARGRGAGRRSRRRYPAVGVGSCGRAQACTCFPGENLDGGPGGLDVAHEIELVAGRGGSPARPRAMRAAHEAAVVADLVVAVAELVVLRGGRGAKLGRGGDAGRRVGPT